METLLYNSKNTFCPSSMVLCRVVCLSYGDINVIEYCIQLHNPWVVAVILWQHPQYQWFVRYILVIQCCVSCCFGKQQRQVRTQDRSRHLPPEPFVHAATLLEEGLTQRYVAEQLGVSQPVIWRLRATHCATSACVREKKENNANWGLICSFTGPSNPTQYG